MNESEEKRLREELETAKEELLLQKILSEQKQILAESEEDLKKALADLAYIQPKKVKHALHIMLSILSFGIYLPIYIIILIKKDSGVIKRAEEIDMISNPRPPKSVGYKKAKSFGIAYTLDCGHFIRAGGTNKNGRTVFCEVCMTERRVAGAPRMN